MARPCREPEVREGRDPPRAPPWPPSTCGLVPPEPPSWRTPEAAEASLPPAALGAPRQPVLPSRHPLPWAGYGAPGQPAGLGLCQPVRGAARGGKAPGALAGQWGQRRGGELWGTCPGAGLEIMSCLQALLEKKVSVLD